ncbi:MAG: phosphatase PAP2 family protein [Tannerella sp.]|jgi:undecaprenyl-diphosphatase|nr:phosphatase PAP2 family protein [Tannerella sp.]
MLPEWILDCEREAFLWLNGGHTPFWDSFIWLYSGKVVWIPAALWILFTLCYRKAWKESLLILLFLTLVIACCDQFTSSFCKPFFARLRPTHHPDFCEQVQIIGNYRGGRYGFISGHAANAFGFALFTLLLFRNRLYTTVILLWGLLMAYTRIYMGVHFISDILPGALAGSLFGFAGYRLYVRVRRKTAKPADEPPVYTPSQIRTIVYGLGLTVIYMLVYAGIKASFFF